ncbi:ParA family protein [Streptomyces antarcticus]|uniref:ParA family protein n=1 Tax=Streptomyces antarcticus TaxID=2996458 RepID=UPI002271B29C|nr:MULTISPECIES: ParA family protein [unclassified Streptomyces]MCY0953063.1 ParA family protein [Streptomyces sp. H27-S2]MCZ4087335.1 ParA family protein [Streptomyces sp. H34-S5]
MPSTEPQYDRKKVVSKLPGALRTELKVRAAELTIDIQDAVAQAITDWASVDGSLPQVDTAKADSFATWLPEELYNGFKQDCARLGIPYVQGISQAVRLWLETHPSPRRHPVAGIPHRKIVCNQKGGVGKTTVSAGIGQALAEDTDLGGLGMRVLLVDYDPQGHLTKQLGLPQLLHDGDSLAKFMSGQARGDIRDLVVTVEEPRFGKRLDVLPACADAFLLDVMIVQARNRQATLERALEPLEPHYDAVIVDCPPSLGMAMDAAIYYGRRRDGEAARVSGAVITVLAEDSSADAYTMLIEQIESGKTDWRVEVDYLGLVVNAYDSRDGYVVTSALQSWRQLSDPPVIGVIPRLKEQREAARARRPLLAYAPHSEQADIMRNIAREIS